MTTTTTTAAATTTTTNDDDVTDDDAVDEAAAAADVQPVRELEPKWFAVYNINGITEHTYSPHCTPNV